MGIFLFSSRTSITRPSTLSFKQWMVFRSVEGARFQKKVFVWDGSINTTDVSGMFVEIPIGCCARLWAFQNIFPRNQMQQFDSLGYFMSSFCFKMWTNVTSYVFAQTASVWTWKEPTLVAVETATNLTKNTSFAWVCFLLLRFIARRLKPIYFYLTRILKKKQ